MILIGSRSLALRAPQALLRKPVDFDFVCTQEEYKAWMKDNRGKITITKEYDVEANGTVKYVCEGSTPLEFEIIKEGTSSFLLKELVEKDNETMDAGVFGLIPNFDLLFATKDSHRFKKFETPAGCAAWYKHCIDWHSMKRLGAKIRPEHEAFHKLRMAETYIYAHPSLNKSKADFFKDDNITYVWQHDDLHKAVAIGNRPAYEHYLKSGSEVQTDKQKFFECSEHVRLCGVAEETMVLGLERSLIVHKGVWTPEYAFRFALSKVASSITSGFFREFAHLNIFEVLKMYPTHCANYYEKFQAGVKSGLVRPVDQVNKIAS